MHNPIEIELFLSISKGSEGKKKALQKFCNAYQSYLS